MVIDAQSNYGTYGVAQPITQIFHSHRLTIPNLFIVLIINTPFSLLLVINYKL